MNKAQLQQKIARLESMNDQLETEIAYVDTLLKSVGFPQGLASAKEVALELLGELEQEANQPTPEQTENERDGTS